MRPLYKHQRKAFAYAIARDHACLWMEMRLGKTLVCLRVLKYHDCRVNLIVAPYCALDSWETELAFEGYPDESIARLYGSRSDIVNNLLRVQHSEVKWYIINKEGYRTFKEILSIRWDAVVMDESVFIKNPKTQVTRFFIKHFRDVPHRYTLTGLPAPESELDYFNQLYFTDPSILDEKTYWQFLNRRTKAYGPYDRIMPDKDKQYLYNRIKQNCFVLTRTEAGLYDNKVSQVTTCKLTDKARKAYKTALKDFILEIDGDVKAVTKYAMQKFIWLRKIASGVGPNGEIYSADKTKQLLNLLNADLQNEKVVVWAVFTDELNHLQNLLSRRSAGIVNGTTLPADRAGIIKNFIDSKNGILIANPECLQYGAKLSACNTMIYFSLPLGYNTYAQSMERIDNPFIKQPKWVIHMLTKNTVDEKLYKNLLRKGSIKQLLKEMVNG